MRVERFGPNGEATLYLAHCLEVLPDLSGVEAVVTDPPYSSGGWQEAGKGAGSIGVRGEARIAADNLSTRGYVRLIRRVLLAVPEAVEAYLFTDWRMWTTTGDALEDGGFRVRSMIVWDKQAPGLGAGWRSQHELIAYGRRNNVPPGSPSAGNVLRYSRTGNVDHPTQKPVDLLQRLISISTAATVLDPFMGSGTTGVACASLGRRFIGIELDPVHYETACRRIADAYAQQDLFPPEPQPEPADLFTTGDKTT